MEAEIGALTLFSQAVFAVIGLIGNSYIVVLICKGLGTARSINAREKLVVTLSFINLGILVTTLTYTICFFCWPEICLINSTAQAFVVGFMFLNCSSLWISTWLCVYRSIKLTNSQQNLFKWIKMHISRMVPWIIIASLVLAMAQTFPIPSDIYLTYVNGSGAIFSSKCSYCTFWINYAFSSIGINIFILSTVTILHSLRRHVQNMAKNASVSRNPQLEKLFTAGRTVVLLFLNCIIFFVAQCLILTNVATYSSIPFMICILFTTMYPALNAILLITGDQKLKRPLRNLFKQISGTGKS